MRASQGDDKFGVPSHFHALALEYRQKLVGSAERKNHQGGRIRVAVAAIIRMAFGCPGTVCLLIFEKRANDAGKEFFPIAASQLVDALARIEDGIVITI